MLLHEVVVLGAVAGDADRVALLERIRADEMRRHLPGDADQRDGVHHRVGEAGDGVGRAGAGGDQHARRPCRTSGHSPRPHAPRPARGAPGCAAPCPGGTAHRRSAARRRRDSRRCARRPGPAAPGRPFRRRSYCRVIGLLPSAFVRSAGGQAWAGLFQWFDFRAIKKALRRGLGRCASGRDAGLGPSRFWRYRYNKNVAHAARPRIRMVRDRSGEASRRQAGPLRTEGQSSGCRMIVQLS